jgi:hypothetical protein
LGKEFLAGVECWCSPLIAQTMRDEWGTRLSCAVIASEKPTSHYQSVINKCIGDDVSIEAAVHLGE